MKNPLPTVSRILLLASLALAPLVGCQTARLTASSLPPEYLAPSGAGAQRIHLGGLLSADSVSTAIGPADVLEVAVMTGVSGEPTEPLRLLVDDSGAVEVPFVGRVPVAGLEPTVAGARIASTAVERGVYRQPLVNVAIAERATYKITVMGAVSEPGVREVPRSACDVMTAIAAAGGFTEEAGAVVEVMRQNAAGQLAKNKTTPPAEGVQNVSYEADTHGGGFAPQAETIDLADLASKPASSQRLGDRDVVIVRPKQKRVVHVSGLVKEPGQFELTEDHDLRVLDAIAMSSGVSSTLADKVVVIRNTPEGSPIVVQLSISKAKKDSTENLVLAAGDLISVEPTVATATADVLNRVFRITMGVGGNLSLF